MAIINQAMAFGIISQELEKLLNVRPIDRPDARNWIFAAIVLATTKSIVVPLAVLGILSQLWALLAVLITAGGLLALVLHSKNRPGKGLGPKPNIHRI